MPLRYNNKMDDKTIISSKIRFLQTEVQTKDVKVKIKQLQRRLKQLKDEEQRNNKD